MKQNEEQKAILDKLFSQPIEKKEYLEQDDCAELGLFGEGYAELNYEDEEEEEDDWEP